MSKKAKGKFWDGRIRNIEWFPWLFVWIICGTAGDATLESMSAPLSMRDAWILIIFEIAQFWFFVTFCLASVKRLHDMGYSGWWFLIFMFPFWPTRLALPFALAIGSSEEDSNKYGPNPNT